MIGDVLILAGLIAWLYVVVIALIDAIARIARFAWRRRA